MKIHRLQLQKLQSSVEVGKVIVIYGPRRVGKTTLVKEFLSTYTNSFLFFNADELATRELFSSQNAKLFAEALGKTSLVVIDEAQRIPEIGLNLKILVDSFPDLAIIATGSASFDLANKINEPLTGRKTTLTLYPISFEEICSTITLFEAKKNLEQQLIWGSYPNSFTVLSTEERQSFLRELVGSYLYKDVLEMDGVRRSDKIVDLLRLLAFQIGQEVSLSELASNLAINRETVARYLDLLEKVFVIFRVQGFSRNLRKEIVKNHRYYFFDNGVRNALIENFNALSLRDDVGMLWENYIVSERIKANHYHGNHVNSYFWRTYDKKEIDIIEEARGLLHGYECKWKQHTISPSISKAFHAAYPQSTLHVISKENFSTFLL